jgi:hypothetical protein
MPEPTEAMVEAARTGTLDLDQRLAIIQAQVAVLHLALGAGKGTAREDDYLRQCRDALRVIDAAAKNLPMDWLEQGSPYDDLPADLLAALRDPRTVLPGEGPLYEKVAVWATGLVAGVLN